MQIKNITGYKFLGITEVELSELQQKFLNKCQSLELLGTILLAQEGINIPILCGSSSSIETFIAFIKQDSRFADLYFKISYSQISPCSKLVVKIRKEIVTFKVDGLTVLQNENAISPKELKDWLDQDEPVQLVDTRNLYETEKGGFVNAVTLAIDNFRDLPQALPQANLDKSKPVVIYCTGGIRCEKALPFFKKEGFTAVYQLQGGILHYFEQCGTAHYHGDCFVFDDRVSLTTQLNPST